MGSRFMKITQYSRSIYRHLSAAIMSSSFLRSGSISRWMIRAGNRSDKRQYANLNTSIVFGDSVREALEKQMPIVALESTIITHGMPYPQNITCALQVEEQVRLTGATPATIAILNGQLTVGLTKEQIEYIGTSKDCVKTSRRDFGHVVARKLNGGTTVSGTILAANMAGIKVMATGGIGGVHRCGETTMDVSADLQELGRTPVAVVSSGIKSILDIPRTLEYLETQGVYVATYGATKSFPAFYTRDSGCKSPYQVSNALEAAKIIKATGEELQIESGMLFAVPVPEAYALDDAYMQTIIDGALALAAAEGIRGKDVTPYLLAHVAKMTKGKSLETNMALIQNNAKVAGEIAVKLWEITRSNSDGGNGTTTEGKSKEMAPIVVIGGCVLDRCVTLAATDELGPVIKLDGRIHAGKITESAGGVGRNICEALGKLQTSARLVSAIGNDESGKFIARSLPGPQLLHATTTGGRFGGLTTVPDGTGTAQCIVAFDSNGECKFLIGDMEAHKSISPELIRGDVETSEAIRDAPLLVLDGNVPVETMEVLFDMALRYSVPVFYEPTDYKCSKKPFGTKNYEAVKYISPNYNELTEIARHFGIEEKKQNPNQLISAARMAKKLLEHVPNIIVTLGRQGILIARRNNAQKPLLDQTSPVSTNSDVQIRHYGAIKCPELINVSGAGDCFAAGLISAMLRGKSEEICVNVALHSALLSLKSKCAVPESFPIGEDPWTIAAIHTNVSL